jgi:hypothetical protein
VAGWQEWPIQLRAKGNGRPGAQLLGLGGIPYDRQEGIGQTVVNHHGITGQLGGDQAVGWSGWCWDSFAARAGQAIQPRVTQL